MSFRIVRFRIVEDDLRAAPVQALVALHLAAMRASSPPGHSFALDAAALRAPDIRFWTAWDGSSPVGMAALKRLADGAGELKSMRTHPDHLRRGVAATLLEHVIAVAREAGMPRISLETGSGPVFEPALALYQRRGFTNGPAFAEYVASDFNQFLHLPLD